MFLWSKKKKKQLKTKKTCLQGEKEKENEEEAIERKKKTRQVLGTRGQTFRQKATRERWGWKGDEKFAFGGASRNSNDSLCLSPVMQ